MWNGRMDEAQVGIKIAGRNINNLRYADDITLMAESEEELRSLFRIVKEVSEKAGLKLNIQKTKTMASGPIMANRWANSGNSDKLHFWGAPKSLQMVTAAMKLKDTYSLEEKLWLRQHIEKQKHYFANKGLFSQSYGFSSSHV